MENKQVNNSGKKKKPDFLGLTFLVFIFMAVVLGMVMIISGVREINKNSNFGGGSFVINGQLADGNIKKFKDRAELKEFLDESVSNLSSGFGGVLLNNARSKSFSASASEESMSQSNEMDAWGAPEAPLSISTGSLDHSTTNIQVAGVDEADIIKTDGNFIYAISGNEVVIAKAYPAESSEVISRIKLDSAPTGIYINKNKLAVYGHDYKLPFKDKLGGEFGIRRNGSFMFFKIFDISDRKNPKETKSLNFEGSYTNSRMIGDYVYFVTSTPPVYSYYGYEKDDEMPVPMILENGQILNGDEGSSRCRCSNIYYFDIPYYNHIFTSISAINIADDKEKISSEVFLLDGSQNSMFVSANNIYITLYKTINEEKLVLDIVMEIMKEKVYPKLSARNRERIAEIERTESHILSPEEKFMKIGMILERYEDMFSSEMQSEFQEDLLRRVKQKYENISKELEKTVIHKISIDGANLKYKAAGEVMGVVLNQFSMDENNGYFRIATTKNRRWSSLIEQDEQESYSNLYVLDEGMNVVGGVEKLAKGERIYSVRFMQNRAYMVTFRQTDPLFVIDLKNPKNPKVLGELKVPGFSSYLHPYDETTLIGLGKESNDSGVITSGIKLSLFDVSDVKNPKQIDKYTIGDRNSNSIAINDHKAFLFSKKKNLLVIPATMNNIGGIIDWELTFPEEEMPVIMPPQKRNFNGAVVFRVDKNGFELRGKIDHSDENDEINAGWEWNNNVNRSLYIEDVLYTFSTKYLKANDLKSLKDIKSLKLVETNMEPIPLPILEPFPSPGPFSSPIIN